MKKNDNGEQSKRELVKALYLRGSSHREISAATGLSVLAVQKRINRGKWRKLKDAVTNAVPVRSLTLRERSQVVRENLATDLQVSSERLVDLKRSTDPAQEKERQAVVGQIVSSSKEVFSWGEGSPLLGNQTPFEFFTAHLRARYVGPCNPPAIEAESPPQAGAAIIDVPPQAESGNGS